MKIKEGTLHRDVEKLLRDGMMIITNREKGLFRGYKHCIYQNDQRYNNCIYCLGEIIIEKHDSTKSYCMQCNKDTLIKEIIYSFRCLKPDLEFIEKHEFTI